MTPSFIKKVIQTARFPLSRGFPAFFLWISFLLGVQEAFSLQPFVRLNDPVPLLKTMNPQFFIGGADSQTQKVAILIVGLGINENLTEEILSKASKNISLVFSPYSPNLEDWLEYAREEGFFVSVTLPMEDGDKKEDQGYLTLKTNIPDIENLEKLKKVLQISEKAPCLYGQRGGKLLRSLPKIMPLFQHLKETRNCFIAPSDSLATKIHEAAATVQLNYITVTLISPSFAQLVTIEALTKRTGFSILVFDAYPKVLEHIQEWVQKLQEKQLTVVSIGEMLHIS